MIDLNSITGWKSDVLGCSFFLVAFAMIIAGVISPLVFLFSIIPKIEKRMGVKLEYPKFYDSSPLGRLVRAVEIPICIASEYFLQFFNKSTKNIKFYKNYALIKADFNIKDFSRREIVWSIVTFISYIIFIFLGGLLYIIGA